jgi:hypothetical protein
MARGIKSELRELMIQIRDALASHTEVFEVLRRDKRTLAAAYELERTQRMYAESLLNKAQAKQAAKNARRLQAQVNPIKPVRNGD